MRIGRRPAGDALLPHFILILLLFLAAWTPRVLGLDAFVTPDERKWLARSANFYQAISQRELADTFQREHPGVTVMWAGTLGFIRHFPAYARQAPGQFTWEVEHLEAWLKQNSTHTPLELLTAGRRWIALWIALLLALCYVPLRALFGKWTAAVAVLFMAWSPFGMALSRQLHPDGLLASLTILALSTFLVWLYKGQKGHYLAAAGFVTGLAWLTKTPAIFLVPTTGLLCLIEWLRPKHRNYRPKLNLFRAYLAYLALAALTFVLLWPAMWVAPFATVNNIITEMSVYVQAHTRDNYFLGAPVNDPGALFYPVAYLFRTTPAVLLGLLLVPAWFWQTSRPETRRAAVGFILFALLFTAGMTLGAKKFDRYILPVFYAFSVPAALGWLRVGEWASRRWKRRRGPGKAVLSALLIAAVTLGLHGLLGFGHYPYYLTYYNPLAGGSRTAPQVMFIGWGEGLDQVAHWLKQQPKAEELRVVAWYNDGPLSYLLDVKEPILPPESPEIWFDADYAVLYSNQWQRRLPSPAFVDYFFAQEPVHIVRANGLELARIYDVRRIPPPAFSGIQRQSAATFDAQIRLAGHNLERETALPGDQIPLVLYLKSVAPMRRDYQMRLALVGAKGNPLWHAEGWPAQARTSAWAAKEVRYDARTISIPEDTPPGRYNLTLSFYEPAGAGTPERALPVTAAENSAALGRQTHGVAQIEIQGPIRIDVGATWAWAHLTAVEYLPEITAGQTLIANLFFEGEIDGSFKVSTRLVDAQGQIKAQKDQPPAANMRVELPVPAEIEPGVYTLAVVIYDPATLEPVADNQGHEMITVSTVSVRPKPR